MTRHLLVLFTCLLPGLAWGQWRMNDLVESTINEITFTDRYTGYAVFASSNFGSCPSSHGLYRTIDEGQTWIRMGTGTTNNIVAVHFVNALTGWIAASGSEVRKTTDGGASWVQQTVGVGSGYNDIFFKDLNTGFVAGNNGLLRRSVNGGGTWTTIASGVTGVLRRIAFPTANVGYIACSANQLLKTTDGGTNWTVLTVPSPGFNDIYFTSATTGFATSSSNVLKTTDGGVSWIVLPTGISNTATRMHFPTANIGYVCVGSTGVYKTTDAGSSWSLGQPLATNADSYGTVFFTDQNNGYVAGGNGRIAKTTDGGLSWYNKVTGLTTELYTVQATHKDTAYMGGREGRVYKTENGGTSYYEQVKLIPGSGIVQKVHFLDGQRGFATTDSGRIFKTIDGGEHWVLKPTPSLQAVTDLQFVSPTLAYATTSGGGVVLKSTDVGETWTTVTTGVNESYSDLWFVSPDTGFVINNTRILRTTNGGLTWTATTPGIASNLRDIVFVNDTVGYCAGTFGKILITKNMGGTWLAANNISGNAEIRDMWFSSPSTGYFSKLTSQQTTTDSCKTINTTSTACLNTSSTNAIWMTNGGTYGYCVGGLSGAIHQTEVPEIIRTYTSTNAYCPGSTIFVAYHAKGIFGGGNVFTAQLSDASGSFASPTNIGSHTITATTYQSAIITATIPPGANGSNYRIRVVASNPAIVGPDNGYPITIGTGLQPTVSLLSSVTGPVCVGDTFFFSTTNFAGGLNPSYTWHVNGIPVTNFAHNYITDSLADGDIVTVSMVTSLACASSLPVLSNAFTADIVVLPLALGNDTTVCQGSSLALVSTPGYSYAWSPPTGLSNASIYNPVAVVAANVEYHLVMTDSNGCTATDSITLTAQPLPQFVLAADTVLCHPDTLQLQGPSGYAYNWQPGTGLSNPGVQSPIAAITATVQYTLTVTDTIGCQGRDSMRITLGAAPQFTLGADTTVCVQDTVVLAGPAGYGNAYAWTPSTGLSNAGVQSPSATISGDISYTLTVVDSLGCSGSDSISIVAASLPSFSLGNDTAICAQDSILLQGPAGYSYTWVPATGLSNPSVQSPMAGISASISYALVVVDSLGCSGSDSISILAGALPSFSLGNDTAVCTMDSVTLQGPAGYSYAWTPSTGLNNPSLQSPTAVISSTISYALTVMDSLGCSATDSISIRAGALPSFSLGNDTAVCVLDTVTLMGPTGYGYSWTPSTGLSNPGVQSPMAVVGSDISYTLVVADSLGCTGVDSISITALPLPVVTLGNDTSLCLGSCVLIQGSATGTITSVVWQPGTQLSDSTILTPLACPTVTTQYVATVTDHLGCTGNAGIEIIVHNLPPVPQVLYNGLVLSTDPAVGYQWLLNGTPLPGATAGTYPPTVSGNYAVVVTDANGCTNQSQDLPVIINGVGSGQWETEVLLYPNPAKDAAFLHLGEGRLAEVEVHVYAAAGGLVYQGKWADVSEIQLPTVAYAAGLYTVRIASERGFAQKKMAIVK